jgi:hypothetical protein
MKTYRYSTTFDFQVSASVDYDETNVAKASLESLKGLIPDSVDTERNIDIMAVAFNAAVVNKFNKNGDGINTASAMEIKDLFVNKPCNIEHQKDNVVGHIISAGFSEYKGESLAEISDAESMSPFNICLGAVVYKTVNPDFAQALHDSTDSDTEDYQSISASWEIGFNEYAVVLGSGDLANRKIVSDPDEVESLSSNLKSFGGTGKLEDGTEINRLIQGEIYPLGIGFTNNPAADVKGVVMKHSDDTVSQDVDKSNIRSYNKEKEKSSHLKCDTVIQEEQNNFSKKMEKQEKIIKDIEQLLSDKAAAKDFSDEAIANISKVFHDAIREKSEDYVEQIEKAKAEQAEAQTQKEELAKTLSDLQDKLNETENQLQELSEEKLERESQATFDARMNAINESYSLDDEDLKVVAAEVSELDGSEASFEDYQKKIAVVFKSKSNEYIQKLAEEMEAKIQAEVEKRLASQASESSVEEVAQSDESTIEESLEKANATSESIPNNNLESVESEDTLKHRFAEAFRDSVKITY